MADIRDLADTGRSADEPEKRWPACIALLTAGFLPATTARRTAHVSIPSAYATHLLSLVLGTALILVTVAWSEVSGPVTVRSVSNSLVALGVEIVDEYTRNPLLYSLITGTVFAGIELGCLALALLVTPWGAHDEPHWTSIRNALARTLTQTPHLVLIILLLFAETTWFSSVSRKWWSQNPPPSFPAPSTQPTTQQSLEQELAVAKYRHEWSEWENRRPWYLGNQEVLIGVSFCILSLWWIWALLRSVGARRNSAAPVRPPTCEFCGYNLTGLPDDGRCPECGQSIRESLGPDVRPGTLWQRRREAGLRHAWRRCDLDPILRPTWFGRQLKVCTPSTDHRSILACNLLLVFLCGTIGCSVCYVAGSIGGPYPVDLQVASSVCVLGGYFLAASTLSLTLLAAGVVALAHGLHGGRNLMPATMQATAYLSSYLVRWTVFITVTGAAVILWEDHLAGLASVTGIDRDTITFLIWFLPNLAAFVVYFWLLARITAAARYANK